MRRFIRSNSRTPVVALQLADGDADGGLGHVELLRRRRDALAAADRHEDLQMAHGHSLIHK
jgi:hypothetical protein